MSNLLASLVSATGALRSYSRVLETSENNVVNSSTPGYARQRITLQAVPFDPSSGLSGGVTPGELESSRSQYAENAVRRQTQRLGAFEQKAESLSPVESAFDVTGDAGVPGALNRLFQSFAAWAASPNDSTVRQQVLDRAADTAAAFRQTATDLSSTSADIDRQLLATKDQINTLAGRIREYNENIQQGNRQDPGLDAQLNTALENLSELANITVTYQTDGSAVVLLEGRTPLVVGSRQYQLQADFYQPAGAAFPSAPPYARISDASGADITNQITGGKLGGLLDVRNGALAQVLGSPAQAGDLNVLAAGVAERVNQLLAQGQTVDGKPAAPLFQYVDAGTAAATLTYTGLAADSLAATDGASSNGIALNLAGLSNSTDPNDKIQGLNYVAWYGKMAGNIGQQLADANDGQQSGEDSVAQARSLREQISGVSLDEEAALIIQFQRAYEATSRIVQLISDLTGELMNIIK